MASPFEDSLQHEMNLPQAPNAESQNTNNHSSLFWWDQTVTIKVQDVLFRIPQIILARHSPYFKRTFSEEDGKEIHIKDSDVTSSAFENMLSLLHPLDYGQVPEFSLVQWTDVLHLADRWSITALREAAKEAVFPLASSVDRIILGQKYGFEEWLAPSFAELVARDDDLTLEEGERLGVRSIIIIAKGRVQARTIVGVRPTEHAQVLVEEILPTGPNQPLREPPLPQEATLATRGNISPINHDQLRVENDGAETKAMTKAWMGSDRNDEQRIIALSSMSEFVKQNPSHASYVIEATLDCLWDHGEISWKTDFGQLPPPGYRYKESKFRAPWSIKRNMSGNAFDIFVQNYCQKRIGHWNELMHESVVLKDDLTFAEWNKEQGLNRFPSSFVDMVTATRFVRHIIDCGFVDKSILSNTATLKDFWTKMEQLFELMWSSATPAMNARLMTIITLFGPSIIMPCDAIDHFRARCTSIIDGEATGSVHSENRDDLRSPGGFMTTIDQWLHD